MQRASQIIGRITAAPRSKKTDPPLDMEQVACAAWPRAVGPKIARHARASKLVRGKLIVEVEDATWQRNLFSLSRTIIFNLGQGLGAGVITDLELRVVPLRREPQRAISSLSHDEADQIHDPGLRRVYRASRQKEMA